MKKVLVTLVAVLALVGAGLGINAASAHNGVSDVHICLGEGRVPIKVVKKDSGCPAGTVGVVDVAKPGATGGGGTGPQGPQGEPGPQGPQGPPGVDGVGGSLDYEDVTNESAAALEPYGRVRFEASCPSGKTVIGGSAQIVYDYDNSSDGPSHIVLASNFKLDQDTWRAIWVNTNQYSYPSTFRYFVTAHCANV